MHPAIQTNILLVSAIAFTVWWTGNPLAIIALYLLQAPQPGISAEQLADALGEGDPAEANGAPKTMTFVDTNAGQ